MSIINDICSDLLVYHFFLTTNDAYFLAVILIIIITAIITSIIVMIYLWQKLYNLIINRITSANVHDIITRARIHARAHSYLYDNVGSTPMKLDNDTPFRQPSSSPRLVCSATAVVYLLLVCLSCPAYVVLL